MDCPLHGDPLVRIETKLGPRWSCPFHDCDMATWHADQVAVSNRVRSLRSRMAAWFKGKTKICKAVCVVRICEALGWDVPPVGIPMSDWLFLFTDAFDLGRVEHAIVSTELSLSGWSDPLWAEPGWIQPSAKYAVRDETGMVLAAKIRTSQLRGWFDFHLVTGRSQGRYLLDCEPFMVDRSIGETEVVKHLVLMRARSFVSEAYDIEFTTEAGIRRFEF